MSEEWLINKWASPKDISQAEPTIRKEGEKVTKLFDDGVNSLRTPDVFPNANINKLTSLFWQLVGNKITPVALTNSAKTISFWCEIKPTKSIAAILVPLNWIEIAKKDPWLQLGALVFAASQAADFFHHKVSKVGSRMRAAAYEAEYLLTLRRRLKYFSPTPYQCQILDHFPNGLNSLSEEFRYPLQPYSSGDFSSIGVICEKTNFYD